MMHFQDRKIRDGHHVPGCRGVAGFAPAPRLRVLALLLVMVASQTSWFCQARRTVAAKRQEQAFDGADTSSAPNSNADNTNGALPLVPGSAVGPDGAAVELPAPPARIAQLIEKGRVTFRFYNPSVVRRRFAGETRFTLSYTYDARNQWRLIRPQDRGYQRPAWLNPTGDTQSGSRPGADGDTSDAAEEDSPGGERSKATAGDPPARYHAAYLSMMPDLRSLKVQRSHEIVLPNYLIGKNFYNRRLVLHEFDHVQISCSDRVEATFRRLLKETRQQQVLPILESIPAVAQRGSYAERAKRNSHFREISNDWIRKEIAARFEDLVQLVDIRYKALDAETSHGRYDVPEDFRVDF